MSTVEFPKALDMMIAGLKMTPIGHHLFYRFAMPEEKWESFNIEDEMRIEINPSVHNMFSLLYTQLWIEYDPSKYVQFKDVPDQSILMKGKTKFIKLGFLEDLGYKANCLNWESGIVSLMNSKDKVRILDG